jgi:hypothetical protein
MMSSYISKNRDSIRARLYATAPSRRAQRDGDRRHAIASARRVKEMNPNEICHDLVNTTHTDYED